MTEKTLTMPELAAFQAAMSDQLRDRLERLTNPDRLRATTALAAADLVLAQQALATAQQKREAALKNWDERIAQLGARVAQLQLQEKAMAAAKGTAKPVDQNGEMPVKPAAAAVKTKALAARKPNV
jgi:hypothetical protein